MVRRQGSFPAASAQQHSMASHHQSMAAHPHFMGVPPHSMVALSHSVTAPPRYNKAHPQSLGDNFHAMEASSNLIETPSHSLGVCLWPGVSSNSIRAIHPKFTAGPHQAMLSSTSPRVGIVTAHAALFLGCVVSLIDLIQHFKSPRTIIFRLRIFNIISWRTITTGLADAHVNHLTGGER